MNVSNIIQGDLGGYGQEHMANGNIVIISIERWNDLINRIDYMNDENSIVTTLKNTIIDFTNEQVLAVFDEIINYGRYSIDIVKVEEYDDKIVATIDRLQKGGDSTVITQPF